MDAFHELVKEAELVIMHAGAGSIIHAIQVGKIPVVMPRRKQYAEHIDDHQRELANAFEQLGKVVVAEEAEDLMNAVVNTLERQSTATISHQVSPMVELVETVLRSHADRLRPSRWTSAKDNR